MFTSAEMRVSSEPPMVCRISPKWLLLLGTCCNICDHACPAPVQTLALEAAFSNQKNNQIEKVNATLLTYFKVEIIHYSISQVAFLPYSTKLCTEPFLEVKVYICNVDYLLRGCLLNTLTLPRSPHHIFYCSPIKKEKRKRLIWENKKVVLENENFCFVVIFFI